MPTQIATTGDLENAQRIILAEARYSEEHSHPCMNLFDHYRLAQGEKTMTIPKVARMTANDLVDGVDMVDSEDIGMTTVDLTTAEVGLKVVLSDKLLRQANDNIKAVVGRQMGDGMGRKADRDIIALFAATNGGTDYGADNINFTARNAASCIATAKSSRFGSPLFVVHHPNAIFALASSLAPVGSTVSVAVPEGPSADLLRNFYKLTLSGVPFYEDGEIEVVGSTDSGRGIISRPSAIAILTSMESRTEPERDASLRAWELNVVADYGVFEVDDSLAAPLRYEIGNPSTSN